MNKDVAIIGGALALLGFYVWSMRNQPGMVMPPAGWGGDAQANDNGVQTYAAIEYEPSQWTVLPEPQPVTTNNTAKPAGWLGFTPAVEPDSSIWDLFGLGDSFDMSSNLDNLFIKHGKATGVDWRLLKAVAMRESSLNPKAKNEEWDGPGGVASYGLMQVLAPQRLNITGWSGDRPANGIDVLFDPDKNIYFGSQILRWNLRTYGFPRGVSIYNAWNQRHKPVDGPFSNQYYVDDIIGYFISYGGSVDALKAQYGSGSKG